MKNNKNLFILSAINGTFVCLGFLFQDYLFYELWLVAWLILLLLSLGLLFIFIISIVRNHRRTILLNSAFVLIIIIIFLSRLEFFKSEKVLEATLMDDLSAINLTLRANNTFEISPVFFIGESKPFIGTYKVIHNRIVFIDPPYNNDFIPDTIIIVDDKLILNGDSLNPDTSFARYFEINLNRLDLMSKK